MNNIEKFKKVFPYLQTLAEPQVLYEDSVDDYSDLKMIYKIDKESDKAVFYSLEFYLSTPTSKTTRVKLKHAYLFQVLDKQIIETKHPIFIEFVAFLIYDTISLYKTAHKEFNLFVNYSDLLAPVRNCINSFVN